MTVEIEEVKLQEMEEDLANYVKVIKRYDEAVTIKDELIKRYENELSQIDSMTFDEDLKTRDFTRPKGFGFAVDLLLLVCLAE